MGSRHWSGWFLGSLGLLLERPRGEAAPRVEFVEPATAQGQLQYVGSILAGELPQSEVSVETVAGASLAHQEKVPEEEEPLCVVVEL